MREKQRERVRDKTHSSKTTLYLTHPYTKKMTQAKVKTLITRLNKLGISVPNCSNEWEEIHQKFLFARSCQKNLKLTITPGLECNFRCSYCFEQDRDRTTVMDSSIQEALIRFFQKHAESCSTATVVWFGGEPLLYSSVLTVLSKAFINYCEKNGIAYQAELITNGFFLRQDSIPKLISWKVRRVQVTLDGIPSTFAERKGISHSAARRFYARFLTLLPSILSSEIEVVIKINVDRENKDEAFFVVDMFAELDLSHPNLRLDVNLIDDTPGIKACTPPNCLSKSEYIDLRLHFADYTISRGFLVSNPLIPRAVPCGAVEEKQFVIDPEGFLYKCTPHVGIKESAFAHIDGCIRDRKFSPDALRRFTRFDPYLHMPCKDCALILICQGGCPLRSPIEKCEMFWYRLEDTIALFSKPREMDSKPLVEEVPISRIFPYHELGDARVVKMIRSASHMRNVEPVLLMRDPNYVRQYVLLDGHHRVLLSLLCQEETISAIVCRSEEVCPTSRKETFRHISEILVRFSLKQAKPNLKRVTFQDLVTSSFVNRILGMCFNPYDEDDSGVNDTEVLRLLGNLWAFQQR